MKAFFSLVLVAFLGMANFGGYTSFADADVAEKFYCDTTFYGGDLSYFESDTGGQYVEEIIEYDNHTYNYVKTERGCPPYENLSQLNSCAPLAGSIVVGFYDTYYENLIPDYQNYYIYNNTFYFRGQSSTIVAMKEYLYELMGTNTISNGTSINQFKNGLSSYVNEKGYSITYNSYGTNLSQMQTAFQNQQLVVLFLNSYSYYDVVSETDTELTMYRKSSANGHVLVAYGFVEYTFYQGNTTTTKKFLMAAFGDGTLGYLDVDSTAGIDASYGIVIS